MATPARAVGEKDVVGKRKSILDLAPLELDCMNALWPLGEATVREVHQAVAEYRPRAYTTIMTILDRLARKNVVTRRKIGRAYLYRANLTPEGARDGALSRLIAGFFGGSREELMQHLNGLSTGRERAANLVLGATAHRVGAAGTLHGSTSSETRALGEVLDETLL